MRVIELASGLRIGDGGLVLIAGPCVIESEAHTLSMARALRDLCRRLSVPFIFKTSFDKANRSSLGAYRGPGLDLGLAILDRVRRDVGVPILCDIHHPEQAAPAAEVCDVLQIPAFLCRQTDLICAAARTQRPVNVKKGQFMAPLEMRNAVEKLVDCGNSAVMLTERGTAFGYHNLVVDMRSLARMRALGFPVVFDATHSVQLPGGLGDGTGGERQFVPILARAAIAVGIDALFMEVHDDPINARCDASNQYPLAELEPLIAGLFALDQLVKGRSWTS